MLKFLQSNQKLTESLINNKKTQTLQYYFNAIKTLLELANDRGFTNNYYPNKEIVKHQLLMFQSNSSAFDIHFKKNDKKLIVTFLNKELINNLKNLTVKIQSLIEIYQIKKTDDLLIIYNKHHLQSMSNLKKLYEYQNINTKVISLDFLQFNVSKHVFVPKHEKITKLEIENVKKEYRLQRLTQLPFMFISDPQSKYYGFRIGDVVKITRVSKTNLKSISYRLVVENEQNIDKDDIKYDDMIDHSYNSVTNDEETYMKKVTITLTAGDVAENHVGMQQIGKKVPKGKGFTLKDFKNIIKKCKQKDIKTELINLNKLIEGIHVTKDKKQLKSEPAYILILRNGLSKLMKPLTKEGLFDELNSLQWDTKKWEVRFNKLQDKHARHNLCFDVKSQKADYTTKGIKKGTIISYDDVPKTKKVLDTISELIGPKGKGLVVEGNKYYDLTKTGIGYHGDAERRKVVAWRLGEKMSLHYQWFIRSVPIGKNIQLTINGGDIYLMSEKAVGTDWKLSTKPTLRHAAGSDEYSVKPIKNKINKDGSLKKPKETSSDKNYKLVEKELNIKTSANLSGVPVTFTNQAYLFYEKIKDENDENEEDEKDEKDEKDENEKDENEEDEKDENEKVKPSGKCTQEKIDKCEKLGKVCNPKTGRCKKPTQPKSPRSNSSNSSNSIQEVETAEVNKCNQEKIDKCEKLGKVCNPDSGRCKKIK